MGRQHQDSKLYQLVNYNFQHPSWGCFPDRISVNKRISISFTGKKVQQVLVEPLELFNFPAVKERLNFRFIDDKSLLNFDATSQTETPLPFYWTNYCNSFANCYIEVK